MLVNRLVASRDEMRKSFETIFQSVVSLEVPQITLISNIYHLWYIRVICYDYRTSPVTVLTYMCITQDTFMNIVMSWYDQYCADANIPILSYLPCWSCILSTIAFIMWNSFVCKFVLLMLNVFILGHNDSYGYFVICHVFYCILCCICIFLPCTLSEMTK